MSDSDGGAGKRRVWADRTLKTFQDVKQVVQRHGKRLLQRIDPDYIQTNLSSDSDTMENEVMDSARKIPRIPIASLSLPAWSCVNMDGRTLPNNANISSVCELNAAWMLVSITMEKEPRRRSVSPSVDHTPAHTESRLSESSIHSQSLHHISSSSSYASSKMIDSPGIYAINLEHPIHLNQQHPSVVYSLIPVLLPVNVYWMHALMDEDVLLVVAGKAKELRVYPLNRFRSRLFPHSSQKSNNVNLRRASHEHAYSLVQPPTLPPRHDENVPVYNSQSFNDNDNPLMYIPFTIAEHSKKIVTTSISTFRTIQSGFYFAAASQDKVVLLYHYNHEKQIMTLEKRFWSPEQSQSLSLVPVVRPQDRPGEGDEIRAIVVGFSKYRWHIIRVNTGIVLNMDDLLPKFAEQNGDGIPAELGRLTCLTPMIESEYRATLESRQMMDREDLNGGVNVKFLASFEHGFRILTFATRLHRAESTAITDTPAAEARDANVELIAEQNVVGEEPLPAYDPFGPTFATTSEPIWLNTEIDPGWTMSRSLKQIDSIPSCRRILAVSRHGFELREYDTGGIVYIAHTVEKLKIVGKDDHGKIWFTVIKKQAQQATLPTQYEVAYAVYCLDTNVL